MTAPNAGMVIISAAELAELVENAVAKALAERAPQAAEPMLLTCAALCRRLGVSRASIFRWRQDGMPAVRAGDEYRYIVAEVLAWLRGRS